MMIYIYNVYNDLYIMIYILNRPYNVSIIIYIDRYETYTFLPYRPALNQACLVKCSSCTSAAPDLSESLRQCEQSQHSRYQEQYYFTAPLIQRSDKGRLNTVNTVFFISQKAPSVIWAFPQQQGLTLNHITHSDFSGSHLIIFQRHQVRADKISGCLKMQMRNVTCKAAENTSRCLVKMMMFHVLI